MKKGILKYTTAIAHTKTISEIMDCLADHHAKKITTDYNSEKLPIGITFCLEIKGNMLGFSLPCNYTGVLTAMKNSRGISRSQCTEEQALRVGWRIVKTWIEAQCAIVDAGVAKIEEVFLPYVLTKDGETLYKFISEGKGSQLLLN